jgi:hypothetical protein
MHLLRKRGDMLCGVEVGRFVFRAGKELEAEALKRPCASSMYISGKPMRAIVKSADVRPSTLFR